MTTTSASILRTLSGFPLAALSSATNLLRVSTPQTGRAAATAAASAALSPLRGLRYLVGGEITQLQGTYTSINEADSGLDAIAGKLAEALELIDANRDESLSALERSDNQDDLDTLLADIDDLAAAADSGGTALLDGTLTLTVGDAALTVSASDTSTLGSDEATGQTTTLDDLGADRDLNIVDGNLDDAAATVEAALATVSTTRVSLSDFARERVTSALSIASTALVALSQTAPGFTSTEDAFVMAGMARADLLASIAQSPLITSGAVASNVLDLIT